MRNSSGMFHSSTQKKKVASRNIEGQFYPIFSNGHSRLNTLLFRHKLKSVNKFARLFLAASLLLGSCLIVLQSFPVNADAVSVLEIDSGDANTCVTGSIPDAIICWGGQSGAVLGSKVIVGLRSFSVGHGHICALDTEGKAFCWGSNDYGQLGDGSNTYRSSPSAVIGGYRFSSISAGKYFTCGVQADGVTYCWGNNASGQFGNGGSSGLSSSNSPVLLTGGHRFLNISTGDSLACGLTTSGLAFCWGYRGYLGNGVASDGNSSSPVAVSGGHVFQKIDVSLGTSCGLTETGRAYCWGLNYSGQVGDGSTAIALVPTAVANVNGGTLLFTDISLGWAHTCGVSSGQTYCWGENSLGQLGQNATTILTSRVPLLVQGSSNQSVAKVSTSSHSSCFATTGGVTFCFGQNGISANLGTSDRVSAYLDFPVQVLDRGTPVVSTGLATAWSRQAVLNGSFVPLGDGSASAFFEVSLDPSMSQGIQNFSFPGTYGGYSAQQVSVDVSELIPSQTYYYRIVSTNGAGTSRGEIRTFQTMNNESPKTIDVGQSTSCALVSGKAYCWGWDSVGGLGIGPLDPTLTVAHSAVPVDTELTFKTISVGHGFACAVTIDNDAYCWGLNTYTPSEGIGALGIGETISSVNRPTKVSGDLKFSIIDSGHYHTCGVTLPGDTYCWGGNREGQLGDGSTTSSLTPKKVMGLPSLSVVSAGQFQTCGINSTNATYCWGSVYGSTPTLMTSAPKFTSISVESGFICGIAFGSAYCTEYSAGPQFQQISGTYTQVSVGGKACGIGPSGMTCWHRPIRAANRQWYYNPELEMSGLTEAASGGPMYCGRSTGSNIFCTKNGYGSTNNSNYLLPVKYATLPTNSAVNVSQISTNQALVAASISPGGLETKTSISFSTNPDLSLATTITSSVLVIPQLESDQRSWTLTSLSPGTQYFYRVESKSVLGVTSSQTLSFRTNGGVPIASTPISSSIGQNTAQISIFINPNFLATSVELQISERSDFSDSRTFSSSGLSASGNDQSVSIAASQLRESTRYFYRIRSTNSIGISVSESATFTTLAPVGISVNQGALYTSSADVALNVSWPLGATGVLLSNDGGFTNQSEFRLATVIPWRLRTSGDFRQPRNVYTKFILADGSRTSTFVDDITYDPNSPSIESVSGVLELERLSLVLRATDDVSGVEKVEVKSGSRIYSSQYSEKLFIPISNVSSASNSLSKSSASIFQIRVSDGAGNWSNWKDFSVNSANSASPLGVLPSATLPNIVKPNNTMTTISMPKITMKKFGTAKSIATFAGLKVFSTSKLTLRVLPKSARFCKVSNTRLRGLKVGSCKVTITVTPKKGKTTSKTLTLKVTKQ